MPKFVLELFVDGFVVVDQQWPCCDTLSNPKSVIFPSKSTEFDVILLDLTVKTVGSPASLVINDRTSP